jgi:hypothetical protein
MKGRRGSNIMCAWLSRHRFYLEIFPAYGLSSVVG